MNTVRSTRPKRVKRLGLGCPINNDDRWWPIAGNHCQHFRGVRRVEPIKENEVDRWIRGQWTQLFHVLRAHQLHWISQAS